MDLKYKYSEKLFRRCNTRNAMDRMLLECLFADHDTLLASMRIGANKIVAEF